MKRLLFAVSLVLLAGCPKEPEPQVVDPGPRVPKAETPAPAAVPLAVIPGDQGAQHICWKNPTHNLAGYPLPPLPGSDGQSKLDTVVITWSQKDFPVDCMSRVVTIPEYNPGTTCPDWGEGDMWHGTSVPGATVCTDINLPTGITHVAATARSAGPVESPWSNIKTYDVPRPPEPPVPPKVLDPVCVVTPQCQRWIGQTLHGYINTPIVIRWQPSNTLRLETEVLTWPLGTSVKKQLLAVGDGTLRWIPTAKGQFSSRARMCNNQSQCSAWVTSIDPEQWVYDIVDPPNVPGPVDDEENDPNPTLDERAAPSPPIAVAPVCRVEPTCEFYYGDTVFGYVGVSISLRQVPVEYYTFGEIRRALTNSLVARRILPPGSDRAAWKPATQGRFWTQAAHCYTNDTEMLNCSDWVGSNSPPTHWQYVIGPLPTGTEVGAETGEQTYDPVEECIPSEDNECEEMVNEAGMSASGVWEEGDESDQEVKL